MSEVVRGKVADSQAKATAQAAKERRQYEHEERERLEANRTEWVRYHRRIAAYYKAFSAAPEVKANALEGAVS